MRIIVTKKHLTEKKLIFTRKLNIELRKRLVGCYVRSIALYGSETWKLRELEQKYLECFEM